MKINNKMLEGTGEVVTGLNSDKLAGQSLEYFATRKEVDALNQVITEQAITIGYLMNRQSYSSHYMLDLFINENFTDTSVTDTMYSKSLELMDDNDWNNNWKYTPNSGMEFSQGFLRPPDQPYMLEVIDEYNLEGVGKTYKCAMKYDSVNNCYWLMTNAGLNAIGEITKLSTNMKDGKVEVIGRWYIPASGVTNSTYTGICSDGNYLYFCLYVYASNTSRIYKVKINSDGTLGKTGYTKKNGESLADTHANLILNTTLEWNIQDTNTGSIDDLINYSETEIAYLLCNQQTVTLKFIAKSNGGTGTTSTITGLGNYIGGSHYGTRSLDKKDNIMYVKINDITDDKRFIYKFDLNTDIVSNAVIKSSGRFENVRNVDGDGNEGICFSHDGHLLEVVSTASNGKFIAKRAIKNALWAENQVCGERKTIATTAGSLCVESDAYLWVGEGWVSANTVKLFRYNLSTGTNVYCTLIGQGWTHVLGIAYNPNTDVIYLLGYDATNYEVYFGSKSSLVALMSVSGGNITLGTTWGTIASGIGAAHTNYKHGLCYDGDSNILYVVNDTDDKIDTLSIDGVTYTEGVYDLPAPTTFWGNIAYKNGNIYILDRTEATTPCKIFVIPKNKINATSMWRSHIYQDPSASFLVAGSRGIAFFGNDLMLINSTTGIVNRMKVLEDPDVMQLHYFLDANNILLSNNVSCCTPIVERYFEPEQFADIRDCPDKNYMAVGYGDEGFSILHLDKFLSGRSNTGKPRYDVRDIRTQHYKASFTSVSVSNLMCKVGTDCPTSSIIIENDLILVSSFWNGSSGLLPFMLIDLKKGKSITFHDETGGNYSGYYYNGTLSERNDSKGYVGTWNSEFTVSSNYIRKIHARTFFKDDASDYNGENPKTFVAIGTDGGCNLLVIDWDENGNRTPVKVWNAVGYEAGDGIEGRYANFIAPSGYLFYGVYNANGNFRKVKVPVWEISKDNGYGLADGLALEIGQNILGGYAMDISPNSRCWKTPSGTWRHQLVCSTGSSGTSGYYRIGIVDVENANLEIIHSSSSATYSYWQVDNFEDRIFTQLEYNSANTHYPYMFQKLKFLDKKVNPSFQNGWADLQLSSVSGAPFINGGARPRFTSYLYNVAGRLYACRYSSKQNIWFTGSTISGLQGFLFPKQDQATHTSKTIELTYNPTAVLNKNTTYIEGQE